MIEVIGELLHVPIYGHLPCNYGNKTHIILCKHNVAGHLVQLCG